MYSTAKNMSPRAVTLPLYRGNMKPESIQQTENHNCDPSHVKRSTNTSQKAQQSSKIPHSVLSTTVTSQNEELISGIQVTSYILRKVSQQITRMEMMDAEVTTENTVAQAPLSTFEYRKYVVWNEEQWHPRPTTFCRALYRPSLIPIKCKSDERGHYFNQ